MSNWNTLKDARKEAREQINTGKVIYCSIGFDKHTGFYAQSNQNTHRSDRRYWVPDYDPLQNMRENSMHILEKRKASLNIKK